MDQIIQSNNSSTVYKTVTAKAVKNYGYSQGVATSNISKNIRRMVSDNTISGSPHGQEVIWTLPSSEIARLSQIKVTPTFGAAPTAAMASRVGGLFFNNIRLVANNKTIATLSDSYLLSRTYNETDEVKNALVSRSYPRNPTSLACINAADAGDTTGVFYVNIFSTFFEDTVCNLDLGFVEKIQIIAQVNSSAAMGLANDLTGLSCQLLLNTYMPDLKTYQLLKAENFNPNGEKLTMYCYNTYKESQSQTAAGTSTTIRMQLHNIYPDINTYFYVMATGTSLQAKTNQNMFEVISSFSLSFGGSSPIIDGLNCLEGSYETDIQRSSSNSVVAFSANAYPTTVSYAVSKPICLAWGLDKDRVTCSGLLSFKNLPSPILEVTFVSTDAVTYNLVVVHEFAQLVAINPLDSSISVTAAN